MWSVGHGFNPHRRIARREEEQHHCQHHGGASWDFMGFNIIIHGHPAYGAARELRLHGPWWSGICMSILSPTGCIVRHGLHGFFLFTALGI